ncbi:MAG: alpha-amylase family protein [Thermoanaerobaculia bacterium]
MIGDLWYKNNVIYSLDLETFMDSNGDGVGDIEGLIRRLDYLESLGVGVLWIAPFQPTPNRDNGYDISDYFGVDPRHGSSGDFVELIHQAHARGLKIIIDLVVNHTSDRHPWFQEARRDPESLYRDWYTWSKKRPPDWDKGMVFPGIQKATWTRDEIARQYYFHRFYAFQPDLNTDNPEVREQIRRIVGFWLQTGVSGFRVDAVPFIIESVSPFGQPHQMHFEYLTELREFLQWRSGDAVLLGEANVLPKENKKYFADGRGLHMMFNFFVNQHLFYALATGDVRPLIDSLRATRRLPPTGQWAQFLRNHDELDLGRLGPEMRERVFQRFGPEPRMQLYDRGIRRRLASMLGDRARIELAYSVMFSLPGTPVIRYGDEIGMGEDLSLDQRDSVRTPMQWTDEPNAGFSTAEKLIHPVIDDGVYGYRKVNVEAQRRDPDSLMRWMTRMIRIRRETPEIGWGDWDVISTGSPNILALCYRWEGKAVVVVHNFDERSREAKFRLKVDGGERLVSLFDDEESRADARGTHRITLDANGYRWYRVGSANYALRHEAEDFPTGK